MNRPRPARYALFCVLTLLVSGGLLGSGTKATAQLSHEWITDVPAGVAPGAGLRGMAVDDAGVTFITGMTGSPSNADVITAAISADGSLAWSHVFEGPQAWHDHVGALALGPRDELWVVGNTPGIEYIADLLLLKYDAATGALLRTIQFESAPFTVEVGTSLAVDASGAVFVVGARSGDGTDALVLKFDADGLFQWMRSWDGPPVGQASNDAARKVLLDANGDPVVIIQGVVNPFDADYVVVKYASSDGATLWESAWVHAGQDEPVDAVLDALGDIYVTGNTVDAIRTLKLRGSDGAPMWEASDSLEHGARAASLSLDGLAGVVIAGTVDPDAAIGNDDLLVVRRDAQDGAFEWSFHYGAPCTGCYDAAEDVLIDAAGRVIVSGSTNSAPHANDMLTLVLDGELGLELARDVLAAAPDEFLGARHLALDPAERLIVGGLTRHLTTGSQELTVVGYPAFELAWENYCISAPNSFGRGARIGAAGSASVAENDFLLTVGGAAPTQLGLFFYSANASLLPFGEGWSCTSGASFRLGPPQQSDSAGLALRPLDFTQAPAASGAGEILGGSTWYLQYWYRDPVGGGTGFNLSDGLAVDFLP